jgi:predicted amidohydrolase
MSIAAVIQMTSGGDVRRNLDSVRMLLERAAGLGASLAVLPENFALMPLQERQRLEIAESQGDGPVQHAVATCARDLRLWIVAGTLPMRGQDDDRPTASCLVFDPQGRIVARYDKIHLFDVDIPGKAERYRESATTAPGSEAVVVDTPIGRLGLSVCYDLRFPELYRALAAKGATVLTVPSAFTAATGRAHWEVLLRARAIENQCHVLAAAQSGLHENGRETYGDSMIVEPWGSVQRRLPRGTGVLVAGIDAGIAPGLRRSFPVLNHRRLQA